MTDDPDAPVDDDGGQANDDGDETATEGTKSDDDGREGAPLGDLRDRVVEDRESTLPVSFPEDESGEGSGDVPASGDVESNAAREDADADDSAVDGESERPGPLGDLAAGVDERRRQRTAEEDDFFESMDVDDVDSDALWEQVEREETTVGERRNREIREVDKHKYCQKCPHFSEPPDVHCTHEGTEIRKQVDVDHFEVADCPVVLEDERLEDVTTD